MRSLRWIARCALRHLAMTLIVLSSVACSSVPATRYHQLSARTPLRISPLVSTELVVEAVRLPESLDRLAFVVRQSANRVQVVDTERWVSPLSDQLTRTWIIDLQASLSEAWVRSRDTPGRSSTRYGLRIEVEQLDMTAQGEVNLGVHWALLDAKERVLRRDRAAVHVQASAPGFDGLAPAVSQAVAQVAREMASTLRHEWLSATPVR